MMCSKSVQVALVLVGSLVVGVGVSARTPGTHSRPAAGGGEKAACLKCHGPFAKVAARTRGYTAPSGEKTNPHRYVPHAARDAKAVPECGNCHQPHPPKGSADAPADRPTPTVDYCYTKCHHTRDFTPCKTCHPR